MGCLRSCIACPCFCQPAIEPLAQVSASDFVEHIKLFPDQGLKFLGLPRCFHPSMLHEGPLEVGAQLIAAIKDEPPI